jgi:hypothetical protein
MGHRTAPSRLRWLCLLLVALARCASIEALLADADADG